MPTAKPRNLLQQTRAVAIVAGFAGVAWFEVYKALRSSPGVHLRDM